MHVYDMFSVWFFFPSLNQHTMQMNQQNNLKAQNSSRVTDSLRIQSYLKKSYEHHTDLWLDVRYTIIYCCTVSEY